MVDFSFDNLKVDKSGRVTVGGVSSGVDAQAAVDGIITARRIPIDRIQRRIDTNEGRIAALGRLRSFTQTLQSSLTNLRSATFSQSSDVFESRETYLSNFRTDGRSATPPTSLLNVNVSGDASLGENEIEIRQVARSNKIASKNFTTRDQPLGLSGSIRLSGVASGQPSLPIVVDANDSLNDIRDQINAANRGTNATGISASIIQISSTENVLVLNAQKPARDIIVSGNAGLIGAAGLGLLTLTPQAAALSVPAQGQIGPAAGITAIRFDGSQGTDAFQLSYASATNTLTLTRVYDGASQDVNIGAAPGAGNFTFGDFGAEISVDATFDRTVDITPANGVFSNAANSGDITPASIVIDSALGNVSSFDFSNLSFDVTNPANITLTSGTFSGTFDGSTLGAKVVNLDDGAGNQVTINLDVATAFDAQGTPLIALGNHTFTQAGNSGQIDAGSLSISTMSGAVGPLNHADLSFDVTDPAAIIVSFGGFQGTFDGTTTGAKTLTLARGVDTLTLDFTVSQAFDDQGNPEISLNDHTYNAGAGSAVIRDNATLRLLYTEGDISGITSNQLTFDSSDPTQVEAQIGNFVGYFDGTQDGTKEVTLRDDQGNALTIQFVLDDPFDTLGAPSLELDFLDTVVTSSAASSSNQVQASQNARLAVKGLTDPSRFESDLVPNKALPLKNYLNLGSDTGSFSIEVGGNAVVVNYDVNDANQDGTPDDPLTLEGLVTLINDAVAAAVPIVDVRARITDYTSGSRLVIESTATPQEAVILTDPNFLLFDLGVDDEIVIERPTNTVDDLFPGLTLELLNAEEGTTIKLETRRDNVKVKEAIVAFVEAYNAFKQFANQQGEIDPETGLSSGSPLFGNPALRQIESIVNTIVGTGASNQDPQLAIQVLAQIGITFVNNTTVQSDLRDTLKVDDATLNDALLNDFDAVRRLFGFDFTSSDNRVSFLGLDDAPAYSPTGYTLNLSYANGAVSAGNIGVTGSTNTTPIVVRGNILRVQEGPASGLRLFYNGDGTAPASVDLNFTTGFAQQLFAQLQNVLDPISGPITNSIQSLEDRNVLAEQRVERIRLRTDIERDRLLQKFTRMEENLARAEAARESIRQLFETLRPQRDK